MPNFFLAKSDPDTYSIKDFVVDQKTVWDGVHNFLAIKIIQMWKPGDYILIYHSQGENRIVGLAKVISDPYLNLQDPRPSWVAELELIKEFTEAESEIMTLKKIKLTGFFPEFDLVRNSRLSTMTCPDRFINWIRDRDINLD